MTDREKDKLERAEAEVERLKAEVRSLNVQIHTERAYGLVGREVLAKLRKKGALIGASPDALTAQVAAKYAAMGKDFDVLMEHVKQDVMLMSEWQRFAMWLKMGQED